MKNIAKTIAIVAISTLSFNTIAGTGDIKPIVKNNKSFAVGMYQPVNTLKMNLLVEKMKGQKLQITLKNEKGVILYTEYLSKSESNYARKFDFAELKDGKYTFEISNGANKEVKTVNIESQKISIERVISVN